MMEAASEVVLVVNVLAGEVEGGGGQEKWWQWSLWSL